MSTINNWQDVQSALSKLSNEQLRTLNKQIVGLLKANKRIAAQQFNCGERVTFFARGMQHNGKIVSLGQMNHKVITDGGVRWTVAATLLKHI